MSELIKAAKVCVDGVELGTCSVKRSAPNAFPCTRFDFRGKSLTFVGAFDIPKPRGRRAKKRQAKFYMDLVGGKVPKEKSFKHEGFARSYLRKLKPITFELDSKHCDFSIKYGDGRVVDVKDGKCQG